MLTRGSERRATKGFVVGNDRVEVSHLQLSDDTILFLSHDNRLIANTFTLLKVFEYLSGLRINMTKSGLVEINVAESTL